MCLVSVLYKKQASNNDVSSECSSASFAIHVESLSLPNICYVSEIYLYIVCVGSVLENAAYKYEVVGVAYSAQKNIANALNRPPKRPIFTAIYSSFLKHQTILYSIKM